MFQLNKFALFVLCTYQFSIIILKIGAGTTPSICAISGELSDQRLNTKA